MLDGKKAKAEKIVYESISNLSDKVKKEPVEAFEEMEVPLIIAPYSGGGGPWSLYKNDLGLPMIRSVGVGGGGVGPSGDEYFVIDGSDVVGGLIECELSHIHMLKAYAKKALS